MLFQSSGFKIKRTVLKVDFLLVLLYRQSHQSRSQPVKPTFVILVRRTGLSKPRVRAAALIEYRFIPLMISVVKIGDDLSAAALTRGLDNPVRRTNITKVGFTGWDLLAVLIAGAALLSTYFFSPW